MSEDALFHRFAIVIVVTLVGLSAYYRSRADKVGGTVPRDLEPGLIRRGLSFCGLMGFAGLFAYLVWPRSMAFSMIPVPTQLRWAGLLVAVAGVLGAWWVLRTLGNNITRTVRTRENATLVTTGPYRFIRHPLYTNGALLFCALALVTRSWWFLAWIAPAFVLLAIRTSQEEQHLETKFGSAWRAYASGTGRFIPKLTR
jgi:protein-S-isoprenylcysteine O-methyltransferase Ste14